MSAPYFRATPSYSSEGVTPAAASVAMHGDPYTDLLNDEQGEEQGVLD